MRIVSVPGRHGPLPVSLLMPEFIERMLDLQTDAGQRLLRVYISGDTLVYDQLKEIPRRWTFSSARCATRASPARCRTWRMAKATPSRCRRSVYNCTTRPTSDDVAGGQWLRPVRAGR